MTKSVRSGSGLEYFFQLLFTAGIYFILARLSLLLQFESSHATPVWPSSGFAFAIMLIWGYRIAPGIWLGAFVVNLILFTGNPSVSLTTALLLSAVIGFGNMIEALIGTYLIKKVYPAFNINTFFEKVYEVFTFSLIAALMCLVASLIGSTAMFLTGNTTAENYPLVLTTWWLGDFAGILLVTNLILLWAKSFKTTPLIPYTGIERKAEIFVLFSSVILINGIIFDDWFSPYPIFTWAFWVFPLFVWASIRFHQREVITAIATGSMIAIIGTIHHHGPFSRLNMNDALLTVQAFVSILVITKLTLNTVVQERRKIENALRDVGLSLEVNVKNRTAELVNMASTLEQKNQDLQQMNEELSSFAYVASHDLQEPLRKIQMFSNRIIDSELTSLSDTGKDYFKRMTSAAHRMQQLIEDLLTYSRINTAERKIEWTPINPIMDEIKDELKDEMTLDNVTIQYEDLGKANINRFQFNQLLNNLIRNSLKFSSTDRDLWVQLRSQTAKGKDLTYDKLVPEKMYYHLSVKDNGIGFEPQFNEQIFGLFQRLHGKTEYPGTGIGLSICKKIIENHDGYITAHGEPGKGATFDIYVPAEQ